jgi:hypothetical protein
LAETFPAVERLVGKEFFQAVARAFLGSSPPSSPILTQIGASFAAFLDIFPPAAGVPYLGDVACLEQARIEAHHAADAKPISISDLASIAPDTVGRAVLMPHPSLALIRSNFPIGSLWAASTDAAEPSDVDMGQAEDVLVIRPAMEIETAIIPAGGGAFLLDLIEGKTIENAAATGASEYQSFDLSDHLTGMFKAGAFSSIVIDAGTEHPKKEENHD